LQQAPHAPIIANIRIKLPKTAADIATCEKNDPTDAVPSRNRGSI